MAISKIVTNSVASGVTLTSPTLVTPVLSGSVTGTYTLAGTGTLSSPTISAPVLSGSVTGTYTLAGTPTAGASLITSGTVQATTSGTFKEFTGIPSWVKRITVMLNGVSTNSTSNLQIQLGTGSTTYTTSGYLGAIVIFAVGTMATSNISTGFGVSASHAAANLIGGNMVLTNLTGNTWSAASNFGVSNGTFSYTSAGSVPLGAALTAVRITTVNGTDTFDAGSINILYE